MKSDQFGIFRRFRRVRSSGFPDLGLESAHFLPNRLKVQVFFGGNVRSVSKFVILGFDSTLFHCTFYISSMVTLECILTSLLCEVWKNEFYSTLFKKTNMLLVLYLFSKNSYTWIHKYVHNATFSFFDVITLLTEKAKQIRYIQLHLWTW